MKGRVKVRFEDDDLVSDWIPYIVSQSRDVKTNYAMIQGEHVACQMDEHCENGVVLGSIYSEENKPVEGLGGVMSLKTPGGVTIQISDDIVSINANGNQLVFDGGSGTVNIEGVSEIGITAPTITLDGDLTVTGSISADGSLEVSGSISADGEVKTNQLGGVSLSTHKHLGVQPGPGITGTPQPGS